MSDKPAWLPDMFVVDPFSKELYDRLYNEVFCREFKSTPVFYKKHAVWYFPEVVCGRELIFAHLTSKTIPNSSEREFDPMRSARLPWARPLIEHPDAPEVLAWDYEEDDGNINTYVWLVEGDYVIIMRRMKDETRRIITAYYVAFEHERKKLRKKYERRIT